MPMNLFFSEEEVASLLHRYDVNTLLTLPLEVDQFLDENPHQKKIDWNELVKKTSTGISNPREYQALWFHLVYRRELPETFEDGSQPLDDDDLDLDLDSGLEPLPPDVDPDAALEAKACARVIMASHRLRDSTPSSSLIEGPLMINVPVLLHENENDDSQSQLGSKNIIFPVIVPRQPLPTVPSSTERKRKVWTEKEDRQLRAAVQRWGEGNWAMMAHDFPTNRSAHQLAQRWGTLKKKDASTSSASISTSSQYTAEQLATLRSLSLALADKPSNKFTATGKTDPGVKGKQGPDPAVKAAAVAAGARIVSPSDTSSQLKATQVRMSQDSSLMKSSIPAGSPTDPKVHSNVRNTQSDEILEDKADSQNPGDLRNCPNS